MYTCDFLEHLAKSHAVYFLQQLNLNRLDVVNFLSHGIEKNEEEELIFTEGCQEGGPHNGSWDLGERYATS